MLKCATERSALCEVTATVVIESRDGNWASRKCKPCLEVVQNASGSFDGLYRVWNLTPTGGLAMANRSACFH